MRMQPWDYLCARAVAGGGMFLLCIHSVCVESASNIKLLISSVSFDPCCLSLHSIYLLQAELLQLEYVVRRITPCAENISSHAERAPRATHHIRNDLPCIQPFTSSFSTAYRNSHHTTMLIGLWCSRPCGVDALQQCQQHQAGAYSHHPRRPNTYKTKVSLLFRKHWENLNNQPS